MSSYHNHGNRDPNRGLYGATYDSSVDRMDDSTLTSMQQHYWEAKQIYLKNIKKKEDECIVSSDADLDAKLELFRSIEESCGHLLWTLERYQDRLWVMAHEESGTGRFLRDAGKMDKSRAGIVLTASGKTLSITAQNRIKLRDPLIRLYRDIETFQYRAVTDTYETIDKMESCRTRYRAALLWMKDVSLKLDPDTYKQLDRFRKVQSHVKKSKIRFEKIKLDTHQKIDMLSASRVNMLNHSLALYQKSWLDFFEKTSNVMTAVSDACTGIQYYDFTILKQLKDPSLRLEEDRKMRDMEAKFCMIFGDEFKDLWEPKGSGPSSYTQEQLNKTDLRERSASADKETPGNLLDLDMDLGERPGPIGSSKPGDQSSKGKKSGHIHGQSAPSTLDDLLTDLEPDQKDILADIFSSGPSLMQPSTSSISSQPQDSFLPSDLLSQHFHSLNLDQGASSASASASAPSAAPFSLIGSDDQLLPHHPLNPFSSKPSPYSSIPFNLSKGQPKPSPTTLNQNQNKTGNSEPLDKWLNLFAELDPLANPDAIGKSNDDDRNC